MARKTLYLIDGHAQIYRSYYAPFGQLTSPGGEPTRATYVFCQMLLSLLREQRCDYLAVALDTADETTFRREIDPQYKATRSPPPEDLPPQIDRIREILDRIGVPTLAKPGFEADDILATLARRHAGPLDVVLVSRDKDLEQLLDDHVVMYDPGKNETLDPERLRQTKGYPPEKAVDIQTLTGDSTDNIQGVPGIGPKTAVRLIEKYGSAEAVVAHADELTPRQRENVRAFADKLESTRRLVTLRSDVDVSLDLEAARADRLRIDAAVPIFEELGFRRLVERLVPADDAPIAPNPAPSATTTGELWPSSPPSATAAAAAADYRLIDTPERLADFARQLAGQSAFALDTETTSVNPVEAELVGMSFSWRSGSGYYLPIRSPQGGLDVDALRRVLGPVLADASIRKVGQNIKYDWVVLRRAGFELAGVAFDTMIASYVIDPQRRSHSMDRLARELLDYAPIPIGELIGKGSRQITFDKVPLADACRYAAEDADVTWRLREVLAPRLDAEGLRELFDETEMPLVEVLAEMEYHGVKVDAALLETLGADIDRRLADIESRIHQAAGHPFNIASTQQLAEVLFDEQGLEPLRKTKTGRSTDADTLAQLAAQTLNVIPSLVLAYRELAKLRGTYVEPLIAMISPKTGRLHAGFHQTGTVTGRLSSSDPNLQNIPIRTETGRQIRGAFVAGDDQHVLVSADYSQIELRILAHFCQDPALLAAFAEDRDIHAFVAAQLAGTPIEQVTPEQRSRAKAVNFGIIYGQTAFGLARGTGISRTQAQAFIDRYFARYPRIREFIDQCIDTARRTGQVATLLGRRRRIEAIDSRNPQQRALAERLAVNTVIQGTAADLIKRAMIHIHRRIRDERRPSRLLIQVHDELVFEVPTTALDAEIEMIRAEMTGAMALNVPIKVDIAAGANWLAAK